MTPKAEDISTSGRHRCRGGSRRSPPSAATASSPGALMTTQTARKVQGETSPTATFIAGQFRPQSSGDGGDQDEGRPRHRRPRRAWPAAAQKSLQRPPFSQSPNRVGSGPLGPFTSPGGCAGPRARRRRRPAPLLPRGGGIGLGSLAAGSFGHHLLPRLLLERRAAAARARGRSPACRRRSRSCAHLAQHVGAARRQLEVGHDHVLGVGRRRHRPRGRDAFSATHRPNILLRRLRILKPSSSSCLNSVSSPRSRSSNVVIAPPRFLAPPLALYIGCRPAGRRIPVARSRRCARSSSCAARTPPGRC